MQVLVEVLGKCLKSECLLMWSAEDTFDTGEGCTRTFHLLEVLGSADGIEVGHHMQSPSLCVWSARDPASPVSPAEHELENCLARVRQPKGFVS